MRLVTRFAFALSIATLASVCAAQSLGELARQERAKKKPAQGRVITEDELPSSTPKGAGVADSSKPSETNGAKDSSTNSEAPKDEKQRAAELQATIKAQKQKVQELEAKILQIQKRLDQRSAVGTLSVYERVVFASPVPLGPCAISAASYNDPYKEWCEEPMKLQAELEESQGKLATEKSALEALQEQARRQGYGSAFYDPD